jgi:hypothetical protein
MSIERVPVAVVETTTMRRRRICFRNENNLVVSDPGHGMVNISRPPKHPPHHHHPHHLQEVEEKANSENTFL